MMNCCKDVFRKLYLCLGIWAVILTDVSSKTVSGDFRLSGLNTEYVLGSFAVSAKRMGYVVITFESKDPYTKAEDLFVRRVRDDQWADYTRAPSCTEKVAFSIQNETVSQSRKKNHYEARVAMGINNEKHDTPHYYYMIITDCSLEYYMHDALVPNVHFSMQMWNDGSHVSADEDHQKSVHTITWLLSGLLAVLMAMTIFMQIFEKSSVHAAMFWVMAAAACDSFSSMFELIHLRFYDEDGIGSYGLDCLSAHLEALCDSLVALLLLSIAAGWTLPSDVITVQQNATPVQRVLGGLQSPFGALMKFSPTSFLAWGIIASHLVLAQWGRVYNDDFESYHELAHLPGKILMVLRLLLGICLLICSFQTRSRCPASLQGFYLKLAIVGNVWFQSLPLLTWIVNIAVPFHLRHKAVCIWGAGLQSFSLMLLAWLVTSHKTAYHKFSHLSAKGDTLTESLSAGPSSSSDGPKTWSMGKAKIRLD